ncbi:relaxase/mobilization nuclease domain-containing protein, partial [Kitasatospora sp. NPDC001574]
MVPNIVRGSRTYGLLAYLYGPGRRDEHVDPHLIASWDGYAPDPGRDPAASLKQLQSALDMRVDQRGKRRALKKHVWHCSLRTSPEDRALSTEEWAEAARRVVAAAGIAPDGDPDGCRWVAVRHAEDHVHIAATIVRGDLLKADIENDFYRAQAECRKIETEWGLRRLNPGDGTAAKQPTNREKHKATRLGQEDTSRQLLRDAVRQALAGATDEKEFFARLETAGVLVNRKVGPSGDVLGYSVAVVGERDSDGKPVYFGGYKLAPDLTLPRIRRRLAVPLADRADEERQPQGIDRTPVRRSAPARARSPHTARRPTGSTCPRPSSPPSNRRRPSRSAGARPSSPRPCATPPGTCSAKTPASATSSPCSTRTRGWSSAGCACTSWSTTATWPRTWSSRPSPTRSSCRTTASTSNG